MALHRYKEIRDANKIMNQAVFDHHGHTAWALLQSIQADTDPDAPQVPSVVELCRGLSFVVCCAVSVVKTCW